MWNSYKERDRIDGSGGTWPRTDGFGSRSVYSPEFTDCTVPPSHFAPYGPYEVRTTNRVAIAALTVALVNIVVGTLSLILFPPLTFALCLLGIILGHVALAAVRRTHQAGRSLAIAALVLSYLGLVFELALFIGLGVLAGLWFAVQGGQF